MGYIAYQGPSFDLEYLYLIWLLNNHTSGKVNKTNNAGHLSIVINLELVIDIIDDPIPKGQIDLHDLVPKCLHLENLNIIKVIKQVSFKKTLFVNNSRVLQVS